MSSLSVMEVEIAGKWMDIAEESIAEVEREFGY
jgi:hypothetical protein